MVHKVEYNGVIHTFPDEATPEMMSEALGLSKKNNFIENLPGVAQFGLKNLMGWGIDKNKPLKQRQEESLVSAGRGFKDIGEGAKQLYLSKFGTPEEYKKYTQESEQERNLFNKTPAGRNPINQIIREQVAGLPLFAAAGPMAAETGLLKKLLASGAAGASAGAMQFVPEGGDRTENALKYGGINALLSMIPHTPKIAEELNPSSLAANLISSPLSKEELIRNLEQTAGTKTSLGNVIENPTLKRLSENILPHVPFAGTYKTMQENAANLTKKSEDLLNEISPEVDMETANVDLQNALKEASKEARAKKNELYEKPNKIADESGLTVGRENLRNTALGALEDVKQSPELMREFSPDLMKDLQNYVTDTSGNNLKLSNIFKGKLRDKANEFYREGKMYEYGITKSLQDALGADIDSAIENSGNEALKTAHAEAQENYAQNFAPFEDPDVVKFTRGSGDADLMLSHFLRIGKNDRSNILNKLIQKVGEKQQSMPLRMYLSRAYENGEINPLKLRTLYNKLGTNQRKVLIKDPELRKKIENHMDLIKKNTEDFNTMFNPKTGQRNLDATMTAIEALAGFGLSNSPMGIIGGLLAPALGAKAANKALTSESFRSNLIKKLIEKAEKKEKK